MSLKTTLMSLYFTEKRAADRAQQAQRPNNVHSLFDLRSSILLHPIIRLRLREQSAPAAEQLGPPLTMLVLILWSAAFLVDFNFSLWLLVLVGFILTFAGLRYPVAGLLGIGILVAIEPVTRVYLPEVGPYRWNTLIYWLILIIALNIPMLLRLNDLNTRLLQAYVLLIALEVIYSTFKTKGIQIVLEVGTTFGLLVYALRVLKERKVYYWLAVVMGALGAAGGLVFNVQFNELPYLNPNAWAFFPVTVLFAICLGFHELNKPDGPEPTGLSKGAIVLMMLFIVNFAWVFLSGSRGNMLTGAICFLYMLWQIRQKPWLVIVLVIVALLGYWITTQMQSQADYAVSRLELLFNNQADASQRTSGRSTLLQGGLRIFQNNPLGVGTGGFDDQYAQYDPYGRVRPSHSAWIATMVENGVPGMLLLGMYVLSFTVVGWIKRKEKGLLPLGLLITALMIDTFVSKEVYVRGLWMLVAIATVMMHEPSMRKILSVEDPRRILRRFSHLRDGWHLADPPEMGSPSGLQVLNRSSKAPRPVARQHHKEGAAHRG